jgi:hypothetical protein
MSEHVQPLLHWTSAGQAPYQGVTLTALKGVFGSGFLTPASSFAGQIWSKIERSVSGDNVFGQEFGTHNFIYPFTDPDHVGPPYILRIAEVVSPLFAGNVGRIFFGFGEFIDVTDALSLRGLGFYCDETGNWFALLSDILGDRVRFDTTADTNQPRTLRIDIDGGLKEIRWYVDEVLRVTHVMVSPLDQIVTGDGVLFNDVVIQADAANPVAAYVAAGIMAQITLVTNAEPILDGETQILASMQNAFGGRTQVSSSIAVVRFVPEPDQFSPGVQFDGLNPRFYRGSSFRRLDS